MFDHDNEYQRVESQKIVKTSADAVEFFRSALEAAKLEGFTLDEFNVWTRDDDTYTVRIMVRK